jgi:diacylglycerol kinase
MRARSLLESFKFAGAGIWHALLTQKNMRTHLCLGALALAAGIAIGFEMLEMAILVLTISAVLTAELMNTSIETVVDLVTADQNELARVAKNVAAGAVLVCAAGSVLVGLFLFVPRVLRLLR